MAGGGCGGTARYPSFESYHRQLLTHVMFGVLFLPRVGSFEMGWVLLRTCGMETRAWAGRKGMNDAGKGERRAVIGGVSTGHQRGT